MPQINDVLHAISEKNFTLSEVCVLLTLQRVSGDLEFAREKFIEMGGCPEVFDRVVKSLQSIGALEKYPYAPSYVRVAPLWKALEYSCEGEHSDSD